jgi:GntR family transcriptional regulator
MLDRDPAMETSREPFRLERGARRPLWAQLYDELRRRVVAAEFVGRFPTDRELVERYGVSRHTVREAVRRLDADGLLDRRRGRGGTRVKPAEFSQPVGTLYSLFREIEARGVVQESVVRMLEVRRDAEVAATLELDPDGDLVYLERLRLAGGAPLALDRVWLPFSVAGPLLEADFTRTALYDQLNQHCDAAPDAGRERIQPVLPTAEERRLLGVGLRAAAFAIERLTSCRGRKIEWRHSLVRGDRYAFLLEWPGQQSGEPQFSQVSAPG